MLRVCTAFPVLLAGIPLALVASRAGTSGRIRLTMIWARLVLLALGVRIDLRYEAEPPGRTKDGVAPLLVANHTSWLDPLIFAAAVPGRLLAKREVREWPLIGLLATAAGVLFIDRERLTALPQAVGQVAGALREGHPVVAFPEGTTWCGRGMGRFRPAVFQAALDADAPVLPVALRFLDGDAPTTAAAFVGEDTLVASMLRVIAVRRLVAEVTLLPSPGRPAAHGEPARRAYARLAEAAVAAAAHAEEDRLVYGLRPLDLPAAEPAAGIPQKAAGIPQKAAGIPLRKVS
ncbi:1-acyl-sn-glycerol-3-phosphate acyltransferase [Microtetraspora sp. NBRC 13810]|nr:1-acyl-sn-glycerol-3-phosphate acyltransferase [Microtetraspora sp. NBRC 13810]